MSHSLTDKEAFMTNCRVFLRRLDSVVDPTRIEDVYSILVRCGADVASRRTALYGVVRLVIRPISENSDIRHVAATFIANIVYDISYGSLRSCPHTCEDMYLIAAGNAPRDQTLAALDYREVLLPIVEKLTRRRIEEKSVPSLANALIAKARGW